MSAYTITEKTLRAIVRKRADLAAEYGAQLAKPNGPTDALELYGPAPKDFHPFYRAKAIKQALTNRQWANLRLVNGTTIDCALPVKRMAAWAKGGKVIQLEVSELAVTMRRNAGSSVTFYSRPEVPILRGYRNKAPAAWLGEAIQLNAPANGGEFVA